MKKECYFLMLDQYDRNIILNALSHLRNQQIAEKRPTDPVDDLIIKVSRAPTKQVRRMPYEK